MFLLLVAEEHGVQSMAPETQTDLAYYPPNTLRNCQIHPQVR
jgi:hypothetical protein